MKKRLAYAMQAPMYSNQPFRPDIQGLRAVAVVSVLLFHVWPDAFPGGYVGVDVFFVISGYLITGVLLREIDRIGSFSLIWFYERRVRRLLPAATLVLLTVLATIPLLPAALWEDAAAGIVASALYVENWRLAAMAVDYLGSEAPPTPVQHYWSLSIEEQFYIAWPLIMLAVVRFAGPSRLSLAVCLSALTTASFGYSLYLSFAEPAQAYFVTGTRAWELGVGGLLAVSGFKITNALGSGIVRTSGLAAIVFSVPLFTSSTPFPGFAALAPTLGCAMVIAAGVPSSPVYGPARFLVSKPAQYLGDISYSLYLWHWPVIVYAGLYVSQGQSIVSGMALLTASVVLAHLTKRYVEDRFRHPSGRSRSSVLRFSAAGIGSTTIAGLSVFALSYWPTASADDVSITNYPGPAALTSGAPTPTVSDYLPSNPSPRRDLPEAYSSGCHLKIEAIEVNPCVFGTKHQGSKFVALVGDSHAAQWIPALEAVAHDRGWYVETHTKSGCPVLSSMVITQGRPYEECLAWGRNVISHLASARPNVVLYAMSNKAHTDPGRDLTEAIVDTLRNMSQAGYELIAIADTPRHAAEPFVCLAKDDSCETDRTEALQADPTKAAAQIVGVPIIDMSDTLCSNIACPVVIGNVVAWRDSHHMTATFARMLAPIVSDRIEAIAANQL